MTSFVYRKQAVEFARKSGYTGFRTVLTADDMWAARYSDKDPSPAEQYAATHDFVHHAEVEGKVGVLVVTVTLDELHLEHGSIRQPPGGPVWFTPGMSQDAPDYIVEPLTPSLWQPDPLPGTKSSPVQGSGGPRERSAADSPVKRVWAIADEMIGQPRKDVIAACVAAGVNKSTANTQYYHWSKKNAAQ